jgi:hypothetical protein
MSNDFISIKDFSPSEIQYLLVLGPFTPGVKIIPFGDADAL